MNNEFINARDFVNNVALLFEEQCKSKNLELRREVDDSVPELIFADPKRLKQVLMNLLSNALKFTSEGYISVKLSMQDLSREKSLKYSRPQGSNLLSALSQKNLQQEKKQLNIEVEDTGVGIKNGDLKKLFKSFGKLNDTHKINKNGTGLGLNISKRIVQSMDGEITVESEVEKGTKFVIFVILSVHKDSDDQNNKRSTKLSNNALNLKFGMKNLNSSMAAL